VPTLAADNTQQGARFHRGEKVVTVTDVLGSEETT